MKFMFVFVCFCLFPLQLCSFYLAITFWPFGRAGHTPQPPKFGDRDHRPVGVCECRHIDLLVSRGFVAVDPPERVFLFIPGSQPPERIPSQMITSHFTWRFLDSAVASILTLCNIGGLNTTFCDILVESSFR